MSEIVYSKTLLKDVPKAEIQCIKASLDEQLVVVDKEYNFLRKKSNSRGSAEIVTLEPFCGLLIISQCLKLHTIYFGEITSQFITAVPGPMKIGDREIVLLPTQTATIFNGEISDMLHVYNYLKKPGIAAELTIMGIDVKSKTEVVIDAYFSKVGRQFSNMMGHVIYSHVIFETWHWSFEEQTEVLSIIIVDLCIAMAALHLPNYVLLEIIDWLPCIKDHCHRTKIRLIEGVDRSVKKVKGLDCI